MRRAGIDVNQWRQNVRQKPSAALVERHMAADLSAVLAVSKFCGLVDGAGEQAGRVNRDGRQNLWRERTRVAPKGETRLLAAAFLQRTQAQPKMAICAF